MRRFGLIGFPLGHSFSASYFAERFARESIADATYENFPIEQIELLNSVLDSHPDLLGFNITIPHKQAILPYLSSLSEEAQRIGAVNCVKITEQGLIGYNTDCYGFDRSLSALLQGAQPASALVLGSGGASRAVCDVLTQRAIPFRIVSRERRPDDEPSRLTYAELTANLVAATPLIVNTTPLGTYPKVEGCADLPYEAIGADHYLFDLVYNPPLTEFLRRGTEHGARCTNGYEMLAGQADRAWEIWNE